MRHEPIDMLISEKDRHAAAVAADAAFVAAMNRAIRKGRNTARPGTFVDLSPPVGAKRFYGDRWGCNTAAR